MKKIFLLILIFTFVSACAGTKKWKNYNFETSADYDDDKTVNQLTDVGSQAGDNTRILCQDANDTDVLGIILLNDFLNKIDAENLSVIDSASKLTSVASLGAYAPTLLAATSKANLATLTGLGTGDSPQFTGIELGSTDTTITEDEAGVIAVEGDPVLMASAIGSTVQEYDSATMKTDEDETVTGWHEYKGLRYILQTSEPADVAVNDMFYCDLSSWNPANMPTSPDVNYMALCVQLGDPNMYVVIRTDEGDFFANGVQRPSYAHFADADAAYFDTVNPHVLTAYETCGKILTNAGATEDKIYELKSIIYGMDFDLQVIAAYQMDLQPPDGERIWVKHPDTVWTQLAADENLSNASDQKGEVTHCWSVETANDIYELFCECDETATVDDWAAGSGASGCTDDQAPVEDGATDGSAMVARYDSSKYKATQFVYTGDDAHAICKVDLWLNFVGSNPHIYYVAIYSDDTGSPDSALGTSDNQDLSEIGTSEVQVSFDFSTPTSALANGTTYWVVMYSSAFDSDDYANWEYTDGTTELIKYSEDGSSWANYSTEKTHKFKLYSE